MSEIKRGDLVMVVHTHCDADPLAGAVRAVHDLRSGASHWPWLCQCGAIVESDVFAYLGTEPYGWEPVAWLKKIDPQPGSVEWPIERSITV